MANLKFKFIRGQSFLRAFTLHAFVNISLISRLVFRSDLAVLRMPSVLGVLVGFLCLVFKRPFFVEQVGDPREALIAIFGRSSLKGKVGGRLYSWANASLNRHASGAIYVTDFILQRIYPCPNLVASASNVVVRVPQECPKKLFRALHDDALGFRIGSIGSFVNSYKGFAYAIDALHLLVGAGHNVVLEIVGSGDREPYLERARELGVADRLKFIGEIYDRDMLFDWLDTLDLYIQPSLTEGLPRALIEAMSRGLPCVATEVGGCVELLPASCLVPPGDGVALFMAFERACFSPESAESLGLLNHRRAQDYDAQVVARRKSDFWSSAADLFGPR
ncbi:glycosyltransferase [Thermomonas brevis]